MRLLCLLILLLFVQKVQIEAQYKLNLEQAINMAYSNNPQLQQQNTLISLKSGELGEAKLLPNPDFTYSREDLSTSTTQYNEWSVAGSIPLNTLWNRWANIESKDRAVKAEEFRYMNLMDQLNQQVKKLYLGLSKYSELSDNLNYILIRMKELVQTANARYEEGDISEYEYQRIIIELDKLRITITDIDLEKSKYSNELKLLIGIPYSETILTSPYKLSNEVNFEIDNLIDLAFEKRNDIKANDLLIESEKANLSFNKLKIIPEINLSAGYKKQTDNLAGSTFHINFNIPLFDRNQIKINQSEIRLDMLNKENRYLKDKIKSKISNLFNAFVTKKTMFDNIFKNSENTIFLTAAYSYEYGELTLVELIDGTNAFISRLLSRNKLELEMLNTYFELEYAVGVSLSALQNN